MNNSEESEEIFACMVKLRAENERKSGSDQSNTSQRASRDKFYS